jgi:hypothetical protein
MPLKIEGGYRGILLTSANKSSRNSFKEIFGRDN